MEDKSFEKRSPVLKSEPVRCIFHSRNQRRNALKEPWESTLRYFHDRGEGPKVITHHFVLSCLKVLVYFSTTVLL